MTERHAAAFTVPAEHPSLPGHFPGSPVVPGVVVLDHVLKTMERWTQRAVTVSELRQVKFHAPLLPAERADVALELEGQMLRFKVTREAHLIAQGTFVIAREPAPAPPS
jgi:3-hydroxymyristoyl/3-hydroxydecanoyl-(acyl carrier protein) dehydratase